MQQNKTLFFVIIGIAVVAVAGMALVAIFLPGTLFGVGPIQSQVDIEVVVAPPVQAWAEESAQAFNQTNRSAQVRIVAATGLVPAARFQLGQSTTQAAPPAAWLAEASFVVAMAARDGYDFSQAEPVASSTLVWGAYGDKLAQFNETYGELNWANANIKATGREGFKLVMASPKNRAEGLAVLAAAAAAHLDQSSLSSQDIGRADRWLTETLGNNNAQPRAKPAETLASVQGRSIGDVGLLATASWRRVGLDQSDEFSTFPAEPAVALDYPLAIWDGAGATPEAQETARAFQQFLLQPEQQTRLADYGLDPAGTHQSEVDLDGEAAQRLLNWADRVLR